MHTTFHDPSSSGSNFLVGGMVHRKHIFQNNDLRDLLLDLF